MLRTKPQTKAGPARSGEGASGIVVHENTSIIQRDDDFDGWLLGQIKALRNHAFHLLDCDHLAEELEDVAALRRGALESDLIDVLHHLLKLGYGTRPGERQRRERQWKLHLTEHRLRTNRLLSGSGTLRAEFKELIADAYKQARRLAGIEIDPDQAPVGPGQCPWSTDQILDEDFFPPSAAK
jgi:hypothetical protein